MARASSRPAVVCLSVVVLLWLTSGIPASLLAQEAPKPPTDVTPPGFLLDEPDEKEAPATRALSGAAAAAIAGMVSIFFGLYLAVILFAVLVGFGGLILSCLAIYDCARRDFPDPNTRAIWCLLIALLRLIGAIIYYFVVYRKNDPPIQPPH